MLGVGCTKVWEADWRVESNTFSDVWCVSMIAELSRAVGAIARKKLYDFTVSEKFSHKNPYMQGNDLALATTIKYFIL